MFLPGKVISHLHPLDSFDSSSGSMYDTHAKCITGMTPEIYDNYINNLEVIPHICKFCVNPSGVNNSSVSIEQMLEHKTATRDFSRKRIQPTRIG